LQEYKTVSTYTRINNSKVQTTYTETPTAETKRNPFAKPRKEKEKEKERDLYGLEICSGEWLMGVWADEEELVDDGGDGGTNEWADPVDPVVVP